MTSKNVWIYRTDLWTASRSSQPRRLRRRRHSTATSARSTRPPTETSRQYVVVDTGFWIFGKKRLIPAGIVDPCRPRRPQGLRLDDQGPDQAGARLRRGHDHRPTTPTTTSTPTTTAPTGRSHRGTTDPSADLRPRSRPCTSPPPSPSRTRSLACTRTRPLRPASSRSSLPAGFLRICVSGPQGQPDPGGHPPCRPAARRLRRLNGHLWPGDEDRVRAALSGLLNARVSPACHEDVGS